MGFAILIKYPPFRGNHGVCAKLSCARGYYLERSWQQLQAASQGSSSTSKMSFRPHNAYKSTWNMLVQECR
jgi:hypothetical protein